MMVISTAVISIFSGFSAGYAYSYVAEALTALGMAATILTLWPIWNILRSNPSRTELALALAYIPHALFLIPNILFTSGLLPPSLFNMLGVVQGSMLQITLLQIALLFKLRDIQLERNQAVEKAIKADSALDRERQVRDEQSRFLSMITHEIRTPLAVIDMAVQSIRVLDGDIKDTAREVRYSRIQSAVKRMATLMELGLKKDGVAAKVWTPDDQVDLVQLSQNLHKDFPTDELTRIELDCQTGSAEMTGNTAALKLTFFNLVENALKYSGDRAPLTLPVLSNEGSWIAPRVSCFNVRCSENSLVIA
ncbi:MAG: sensor histidine kinase [Endozoicomonas sp.]